MLSTSFGSGRNGIRCCPKTGGFCEMPALTHFWVARWGLFHTNTQVSSTCFNRIDFKLWRSGHGAKTLDCCAVKRKIMATLVFYFNHGSNVQSAFSRKLLRVSRIPSLCCKVFVKSACMGRGGGMREELYKITGIQRIAHRQTNTTHTQTNTHTPFPTLETQF